MAGTRLFLSIALLAAMGMASGAGAEEAAGKKPAPVPEEEYPIYDLVVESKYLTSATALVLIERLTVARVDRHERKYLSREFFEEQEVFDGRLPAALVDDFFFKLRTPSLLEGRFGFGVRYRFFSNGMPEEPEVSLAPMPASSRPRRAQGPPPTLGVLAFSRVGFTQRENQALVYVEEERPDGTGGGMLVWLHRRGTTWTITETDVLWIARPEDAPEVPVP